MKSFLYELCRWLAVAAAVLFLISSGAAGRGIDGDPQAVLEAVIQNADMTSMQPASHQMIKRLYGIDPSEYAFCTLYYPLTNMDVDELLIVKYADHSQEASLREAVDARLEGQKKVFESYGVGQMDLMTHHSFYESRAGIAVFAVNAKSDDIRAAFIRVLEGK